ncbi:TatD family hydrolase [Patescibacteria group bacterium]|nr:TatD family hydrolase [Patescibacteria group bacterium]
MLIDSHAHVNFVAFKDDSKEVLDDCLKNDIWVINVGSQFSTSKRAVEMAQKYEKGIYAVVGLHPIHLSNLDVDEQEVSFKTREEEFDHDKYKKLAQQEKVVAIGETGLDYFHIKKDDQESKERQKKVLVQLLQLADELKLPIVLHCRDAYDEMLEILEQNKNLLNSKGVIHCYGGSFEQAERFISLGMSIGITGIVTFGKKAQELQEVVKSIDIKDILIETDCPYLAPEPHRGKRNQPQYVKHVAEKVAEIKDISYNKVSEITTENAINLFKLK